MTSFLAVGIWNFIKLNIGYQPFKFQISLLSGLNFMVFGVKHQQNTYMMSLWPYFLSLSFQISVFCRTLYRHQPSKFNCSRFIWIKFYRGGEEHLASPPLPWCYNEKRPIAYRDNNFAASQNVLYFASHEVDHFSGWSILLLYSLGGTLCPLRFSITYCPNYHQT